MLADLDRLRAVQVAQEGALEAGDTERLEALHLERLRIQARLTRDGLMALAPADRDRAEALIATIARAQVALVTRAAALGAALGAELRGLGTGRSALTGYRPAAVGASLLLDRAG